MSVRGIYADEAVDKLDPNQWVNIYSETCYSNLEFYGSCQMKELESFVDDEPLEFFVVEPTDEDGNLIALKDAIALKEVALC